MKKYLSLFTCLLMVTVVADAKKLYKWVDENGNVTYSDQVPPDRIKKEHQELNKDGVVLEDVKRAKTEAEIKAVYAEEQRQKEQQRIAKENEIKRQNILKSYANEGEIVRLKEERVFAIEKNIESAKQNMVFQKKSLEDMMAIAASHERSGKKVSKALLSRIETIEEKIKDQNQFIESKQKELEKVKVQFDNALKVYREAASR